MESRDVTLAVLAGGRGSRMGRPKSGLMIQGVPILRYLAGRLDWPGPTLLVTGVGNERPVAADAFEREVTDAVADEGPLRGVLTALDAATTDLVACVTVDMPGVARAHIEWLIGQLRSADAAVLCSRASGEIEPFPLVIRRSMRDAVVARLGAGRRAVHAIATEAGVRAVAAPWEDGVWTNLNFPSDLDKWLGE